MKHVLEKNELVETARSKAKGSKVGLGFFAFFYALFTCAFITFSWIFALLFAAFMAVMFYFLWLSTKEKAHAYKMIRTGNFRILQETIVKREQEKSGGMQTHYFYLDEKRRIHVDQEMYAQALEGHTLYTFYLPEAKMPLYVYPEKEYTIGRTLSTRLVTPEAQTESE